MFDRAVLIPTSGKLSNYGVNPVYSRPIEGIKFWSEEGGIFFGWSLYGVS
jgi:hypothetical protein